MIIIYSKKAKEDINSKNIDRDFLTKEIKSVLGKNADVLQGDDLIPVTIDGHEYLAVLNVEKGVTEVTDVIGNVIRV